MEGSGNSIFLFGASGHAKVVIDIIEKAGMYEISCVLDDNPALQGVPFMGYPVEGGRELMAKEGKLPDRAIVAIGDNNTREMISRLIKENHFELVSGVHPSAQLGRDVVIGKGTVVMANVVVNPASFIGNNVILNTSVVIDHDCEIEDGVHIAPGSTLCGAVKIGRGSFVGAGSTVIQNVTIGSNVFVGAGSVIVEDIPDNVKVTRAMEVKVRP